MTTVPTGLHVLKVVRIGRRQSTSVIAVAADNSGQELLGVNGEVHSPSCQHRIILSKILVPTNITAHWANDRERLWLLAEEAEKRSDANLATLWEGHFPASLQQDQCKRLAFTFGQFLADYLGSAVDLSIQSTGDDNTPTKLFALCTAREVQLSGFGDKNRFGLSMAQGMKRGLPTTQNFPSLV